MSVAIDVAEGQPIPLQAQEVQRRTDKVVRATLYNMTSGAVITSGVVLTHVAEGLYRNNSQLMPDVEYVLAQYQVFESNGTTPNTDGDQAVSDLFKKQTAVAASGGNDSDGVVGVVMDEETVVGTIPDTDETTGVAMEDTVSAEVSEDTGVGTVSESETVGSVVDDTTVVGETDDE